MSIINPYDAQGYLLESTSFYRTILQWRTKVLHSHPTPASQAIFSTTTKPNHIVDSSLCTLVCLFFLIWILFLKKMEWGIIIHGRCKTVLCISFVSPYSQKTLARKNSAKQDITYLSTNIWCVHPWLSKGQQRDGAYFQKVFPMQPGGNLSIPPEVPSTTLQDSLAAAPVHR